MRGLPLSTAGLLLATTMLAGASDARAQTTPPAVAAPRGGIEEIVVTAQRREQSAQEVGIAVTAITGEELTARGVTTVNQLENLAPSLEVESAFGGGQPQFRLRGVGFEDYATNNTPTVGVYVDEVAYPIPAMTQGILFDMERVEVLRGPQGTLYGRNTTGGAVNFITRKPTAETSAGATVEYGRFNRWQAEGFVSGALAPTVRARLAATTTQGGGWQENRTTGQDHGDADRLGVRGQIAADAGEAVELLLSAHWYRDESDGQGLYLFRPAGATRADTGRRATGWGTSASFAGLLGIARDTAPFRDNEGYGASLRVTADLSGTELVSLTSYETLDRFEYNDWDATPQNVANQAYLSDGSVFAQELRLSGQAGDQVRWLVGGYYSSEELDEDFRTGFTDVFGFDVSTNYDQEVETASLFGQGEYQLNPQVNLILGLRYEDETRELKNFNTVTFPVIGLGVTNLNRSTDLSELTGKAGVEFQANDDVLFYGTVSKGIKSGGFTAVNTLAADQVNPFAAEELWAYEVGVKTDVPAANLRLNAAAFWYDYTDQQVLSVIIDPVFGAVGRFANVPESTIWGGEAELTWQPVETLTITQSLGYKEGEYDRFVAPDLAASSATCFPCRTVTVDRSGEELGFPNWSYGGSATLAVPLQAGYTVTAAADYSYRDTSTSNLLGPVYTIDSYWLFNASLSVGPTDGNWQATLWARNLFDAEYDETRNFFIGGWDIAAAGAPATYGVRVSVGF